MKKMLAVLGLALGLVPCAFSEDTKVLETNTEQIALINGNVLDVVNERIIANATVLVEGKRIKKIVKNQALTPEGAQVIDLEGRWVLPGYIDPHTHFFNLDGAERALRSGVTTARNAQTVGFVDVAMNALFHAGGMIGPEVIPAGSVYVMRDFMSFGPNDTVLADPRLAKLHKGLRTDDDIRELIRIGHERGVHWIKMRTNISGRGLGVISDRRKQAFTADEVRVAVDEAAKYGHKVMVHAFGVEPIQAAIDGGAATIEHVTGATIEQFRQMKKNGQYAILEFGMERNVKPASEYWRFGTHEPNVYLATQYELTLAETFRRARKGGVKILAGADTGYGPDSWSRLFHTITAFAENGMSSWEALKSATLLPAEMLGMAEQTGQLKKGYDADIIVLHGNPIENPKEFQDVVFVMSDGKIAVNHFPFRMQ